MLYSFGAFKLDPQKERLTCGIECIPLTDRMFRILLTLVEANGQVVSREQLNALLWPQGTMPEKNLSQYLYLLRQTLGERAGDRLYIATVHRKGFRFVAPINVLYPAVISTKVERNDDPQPQEPDLAVHRTFARASKLLDVGTAAALQSALGLFLEAGALDPTYAPAYIGQARVHLLLVLYGYSAKHIEYPRMRHAIAEALRLDNASAAAHAVSSNILLFCDWDRRNAHRAIDTATQISPESSLVLTSSAWVHAWTGHPKRAVKEAKRALLAEPSSTPLQLLVAQVLTYCGEPGTAALHLSDVIHNSAQLGCTARRHRAQALLLSGHPREALLDLTSLPEDHAEDLAWRFPLLGQTYAQLGDLERARELYQRLLHCSQSEYVSELSLLLLALALSEFDCAVDHLWKATTQKHPSLPIVRSWSALNPIRKTETFKGFISAIRSAAPATAAPKTPRAWSSFF